MSLNPIPVTRRFADLTLLRTNARYMRNETYQRLVDNLRRDQAMTSTPLIYGAGEYPDGAELVLSGNHRVMAAIDAGIESGPCLLLNDPLPDARRTAVQLSHNALEGDDDLAILKQLYESIDDVDARGYAGLDDKTLELLDTVDLDSLGEANLEYQQVNLVFLPPEVDAARAAFDEITRSVDETWVAAYRDYEKVLDALDSARGAYKIGNTATAFGVLVELVERHLTDLQDGYLPLPGQTEPQHDGHVGLEVALGARTVPAGTATALSKALASAIQVGAVEAEKPWQFLDQLVAAYHDGPTT